MRAYMHIYSFVKFMRCAGFRNLQATVLQPSSPRNKYTSRFRLEGGAVAEPACVAETVVVRWCVECGGDGTGGGDMGAILFSFLFFLFFLGDCHGPPMAGIGIR